MSFAEFVSKIKEALNIGEKEHSKTETEDIHRRMGSNPHATFQQSRPAVNKDEPAAFANPVEAGAKKPSEEQCGLRMPRPLTDDLQPAADYTCPADAHTRTGSSPHINVEQSHPAVNKEEPAAFANPCEAGAKKPSEAQMGKPMPEPQTYCQ